MLSCMTFSLENIHSTLNKKHGTLTVFTYAQSFASSMKESVKWFVEWMLYYFTPREIWYSLPMKLEELKFLRRKKIHRSCPRMKIEECKSGHHQMVLFSKKWKSGNYNGKERDFVRKSILPRTQTNLWCRQ